MFITPKVLPTATSCGLEPLRGPDEITWATPLKSVILSVPFQAMVMSMARRWVWRLVSAAGKAIWYFIIIFLAASRACNMAPPWAQSMFTPFMRGTACGSWPLLAIMQHQCIR